LEKLLGNPLAPLADTVEALVPLLGALEGEPAALDGGITNRNFRVRLGGLDYVLRMPGKDTELLGIDRGAERDAAERAAAVGVAPEVAALLSDPPCLVTRFVAGEPMSETELRAPEALAAVAAALRAIHGCPPIEATFDSFRIVEDYAAKARERGAAVPADYERAHATAARIEAALAARGEAPVLCHDDFLAANFIASPDGLRIVDWEYAGMGSRWFDLGNFAVNNGLDAAEEEALLRAYLDAGGDAGGGRGRAPGEIAALRLMRFMSDFREAMWGVLQGTISDLDFDFAAYARKHFDRLAAVAAAPGFEAQLEEAAVAAR
jgi:thiamine kinase-like enzyme